MPWIPAMIDPISSYHIIILSYLIFVSPDQRCPTHLILESDSVSESECWCGLAPWQASADRAGLMKSFGSLARSLNQLVKTVRKRKPRAHPGNEAHHTTCLQWGIAQVCQSQSDWAGLHLSLTLSTVVFYKIKNQKKYFSHSVQSDDRDLKSRIWIWNYWLWSYGSLW